jgi:ribosome-associated heat shock protein Hsp15
LVPREQQRIDRWLWHARIVKTRTLAASLAASGYVRVNGRRVANAAHLIRQGDVLTVALPGTVRVLRAIHFSERRFNAATAARLYEELHKIAGA